MEKVEVNNSNWGDRRTVSGLSLSESPTRMVQNGACHTQLFNQ